MPKRNLTKMFEEGWNKIFGKEEDMTKLRTKSLFRAENGKQNAGNPHDREDYEEYKKELEDDKAD